LEKINILFFGAYLKGLYFGDRRPILTGHRPMTNKLLNMNNNKSQPTDQA
jgi:hypothetical protein